MLHDIKGNEPNEPGLYLVKYVPEGGRKFCFKGLFFGGNWYTLNGAKRHQIQYPEKIVGYIPWRELMKLFE